MEQRRPVACPENEGLSAFMWQKRQEMADQPKGISDNIAATLFKAYANVCKSKTPIKTLKDISQIKGVGKWILRLMQDYFETNSRVSDEGVSEPEDLRKKGNKNKRAKHYVPQKNSVAYALLITLYRGTANGNGFMRKQELIDAAEASGLSRVPIGPEKGKGKLSNFGSSSREWYSGWSCMKTLITKGLVAKSSCPAKYMLTEEGLKAACECLSKSGMADSADEVVINELQLRSEVSNVSDLELAHADLENDVTLPSVGVKRQKKPINVPVESFERFVRLGFSKEQIIHAFHEVSETSKFKDLSSLWPAVLCHLREADVYGLQTRVQRTKELVHDPESFTSADGHGGDLNSSPVDSANDDVVHIPKSSSSADSQQGSFTLRACSSSDDPINKNVVGCPKAKLNALLTPPLTFGDQFEDFYEVILILDCREQFVTQGSKSRKLIENICSQFKIKIEVRQLPVGDGIWIARHKHLGSEYVLDFIVERKNIDDLRCSIRDKRYKDQKLRLLRCGLKKLIYLVEGDPNSSEASESIKTACFTTEVLEGFDVQRTSGLGDTMRKYGYLTQAITQYYTGELPDLKSESSGVCPPFDEFIKRCQDLDKMTVSDVFAVQLMQIPQVTEKVAIAVLDLYPTLLSLASAYSFLEGDISAQRDMLRKQSNNVVNAVASRNIFQLVWGS